MEECGCCGTDTSTAKGKHQRRRLESCTIAQEVQALLKFVHRRAPGIKLSGYLCRHCCGMLTTFKNLELKISSTVEKAWPGTELNEQPAVREREKEPASEIAPSTEAAPPTQESPALRVHS